jgi:CheY-like chemotaxis protein
MLMKPAMPRRLREALHHAFRLRRDRVLPPEAVSPPPKLSALVVEDNPINQFVLTRMLEQAGVTVTVASQGVEALALAADTRFDVILMDMQMPVMDGLAATRAIRAGDSPNRATRILGLTAAVGPVYERQCREAGMDDYLTKPVAKAALLNALDLTSDDQG